MAIFAFILSALMGVTEAGSATSVYTDLWRSPLEEIAAKSQSRIAFRALDTDQLLENQEFALDSYDLVIAKLSASNDAIIRNPEQALAHIRRALRPGGYLAMLILSDPSTTQEEVGRSEDVQDDSLPYPVSPQHWDSLLRKAGYSGLDENTIAPIERYQPTAAAFSALLTTQAEDDRVSFLRAPLETEGIPLSLESLTIIGDDGDISQKLENSVGSHYAEVQIATSVSMGLDIPPRGTVVCLFGLRAMDLELAPSTGTTLTASALEAIQTILRQARNVLWVTSGARSGENPHGNMIKGLLRSVALEMPDIRTQLLDFATSEDINAEVIGKMLLQLEAHSTLVAEERVEPNDKLWCHEPEVFITKDRQVFVPRLRLNPVQNRRYNSGRRLLTHPVSIEDTVVSITPSTSVVASMETNRDHSPKAAGQFTRVRLCHSLLKSIRITDTSNAYFSLGKVADGSIDGLVLLMSTSLDSVVSAPASLVWPAPFINPDSRDQASEALTALSAHIIALGILETATHGGLLVVLDPEPSVGHALAGLAPTHGVKLLLLTTSATRAREHEPPWVFVSSKEPTRSIQHKVPWQTVSTFLDMSTSEEGRTCASRVTHNCLPIGCWKFNRADFIGGRVQLDIDNQASMQQVTARVVQAGSSYCPASGTDPASIRSLSRVGLNEVGALAGQQDQVVVSWDADKIVNVREQPASDRVSFAPDKTYWLVGLTRGLGLSLCEWMVDRGARHLVLSSRRPGIEAAWLEEMAARGATVKVLARSVH